MINFRYEFPFAIDKSGVDFIEQSLKSSFSLENISLTNRSIEASFSETIDEQELSTLLQKLLFIARNIDKELIFTRRENVEYISDAFPALLLKGDVRKVASGMFMFQGEFLRVFHAVNSKFKALSKHFNAIEQEYPTLWPLEIFKRVNYFEEFPHQAIMCATAKPNKQSLSNIAEKYSKESSYTDISLELDFAPATFGLQPAVCDCCYFMLEGEVTHNSSFTCFNKVFRNESSDSGGLDRLTNFSVRDIMFVGEPEFVLEKRQAIFDLVDNFTQSLKLTCRLEAANDPFFVGESIAKAAFQYASKLKHELLFDIPNIGKPMAFGSVNLHLDFFGKAFDISTADGNIAHSACVGIGLERMVYALFCQHGSELSRWPDSVIEYLSL